MFNVFSQYLPFLNSDSRHLVFYAAVVLGVVFGFSTERGGFCLRTAIAEWLHQNKLTDVYRPGSRSVQYGFAMLVAILGTQALLWQGKVDLSDALHLQQNFSLIGQGIGGLLFGVGMVLAGGCVSRIAVLTARGNLRAWWVLLVLAVVATATMSGVLAPLRLWLQSLGASSAPAPLLQDISPFLPWALGLIVAGLILRATLHGQASVRDFVYGGIVGCIVPAAWYVTANWGQSDFSLTTRPEALNFTADSIASLRYILYGRSIELNFGFGLLLGTILGGFVSALFAGRLFIDGFRTEPEPLRYGAGAVLMGFGGVVGLGCSLGQGLTGMSLLSSGSVVVLAAIVLGGILGLKLFNKAKRR